MVGGPSSWVNPARAFFYMENGEIKVVTQRNKSAIPRALTFEDYDDFPPKPKSDVKHDKTESLKDNACCYPNCARCIVEGNETPILIISDVSVDIEDPPDDFEAFQPTSKNGSLSDDSSLPISTPTEQYSNILKQQVIQPFQPQKQDLVESDCETLPSCHENSWESSPFLHVDTSELSLEELVDLYSKKMAASRIECS